MELPQSLDVFDILLTQSTLHLCEFLRKLTLLKNSRKLFFLFLFDALDFLFFNNDALVQLEVELKPLNEFPHLQHGSGFLPWWEYVGVKIHILIFLR